MAKRTGRVEINGDRCKGCSMCISVCPTESIELSDTLNRQGYRPAEFLPDTGCTGCGVCFYACPEPAAIIVYYVSDNAA